MSIDRLHVELLEMAAVMSGGVQLKWLASSLSIDILRLQLIRIDMTER
jgi:hypothetical protein